jgi:predicted RNA-binding Zn ribbon-like protein
MSTTPPAAVPQGEFLDLFGGMACLDFANTLDGRATAHPEEKLGTVAARLATSIPAGAARKALAKARDLREATFQIFAAVARAEPVPDKLLDALRSRYAEAVAVARLHPGGAGFDWQFGGTSADRPWWPVAVSAVRLLTGGPLDRVKVCAAEAGCVGLFLDVSKNRSRRWCNAGCSLEAKIERQAQRRRAARPGH